MDKKIKEIISYAVTAPSGDNSQPWYFELDGFVLSIFNLPEKDNPYLNFKQAGSFVAHGALLKNIEVASSGFGIRCDISLFPDNKTTDLVARVSFSEDSSVSRHALFDAIQKRETNRRPYKNIDLLKEHTSFLSQAGSFGDVVLRFVADKKDRSILGAAGASAEVIILENELLHRYLFKDVMWSEKQELEEKHGLYIKTMEFNPIQTFLFWLASHPWIMSFARLIKFPSFIAKQDSVLYASGSVTGLLSVKTDSPENFVYLGMKMQEVWLQATALSLAFQPITATLFLGFKIKNSPEDSVLSSAHKELALESYKQIVETFKLEGTEIPLIMFRVGYAPSASAKSSRKDPQIKLKQSM